MIARILEIFIYGGIVQGFFLAFVLISGKNNHRRSNKILSVLMVILSLSITHVIFIAGHVGFPYKIREPFILLIGPLLFFYIRELIGPKKLVFADALHAIPFFGFLMIYAIVMGPMGHSAVGRFVMGNLYGVSLVVWTLVVAQYGYYWWKIAHIIGEHGARLEAEFSNTEGKTLVWLRKFVHVFGVFFFLLVVTLGLTIHRVDYAVVDRVIGAALACTIFVLGYEGLFQEEIFSNAGSTEPLMTPVNSQNMAASNSDENFQMLLNYMSEKKPYLDEALSLTDLAKQLSLSRNQLSELINKRSGLNFYTFINQYRVEEVKRLMSDPEKNQFTILALAYEAGFPSKSSFHAIFKKFTGLTPTEYKSGLR